MNAPETGPREVAAGLAEVLLPALSPDAPSLARAAARDVAQMLGFEGLGAALAQLERVAGAQRPVEADHLAERIARTVELATHEGGLAPFHAADRELAALASHLQETTWGPATAPRAPAVATWELGETLADLRLEGPADARRTRLSLNVASALRAAADWLGAEYAPAVSVAVHDSAVTLTLAVRHDGGLGPAGAVLASVEGSLGHEADGRWTLRVPRSSERPSFLLVRQGRFGLALPWHAVARLRMFAPDDLERLAEPRLATLAPLAQAAGERPAALVALGLARAWFVADRIVWRIAAVPEEADVAGPFAGATRVVAVESGERYWVLEPASLLRGVEPAEVAPPAPRPRVPAPEAVDEAADPAADGPAHEPAAAAPEALYAPAWDAAPEVEFGARRNELADVPVDASALAAAAERALVLLREERAASLRMQAEREWRASSARVEQPRDARTPQADAAAQVDRAFSFADTPAATVVPDAGNAQDAAAAADAVMFGEAPAFEATRLDRPSEIAEHTPSRRALVVDDSLVARIFLGRLLEQRGWIVESVADAAAMWDALGHGEFALVCADFALPDATGRPHLQRLVDHLGRRRTPSTLVVLTRDDEEEHAAAESGAPLVLRKPFDSARLDHLLAR